MKRELFSVADEEFVTLLDRTNSAFNQAGIPYMAVGGVATQACGAAYLNSIYNASLTELKSRGLRMQDYFRATDDVDIAIRLSDQGESKEAREIKARNRIFSVLDSIVGDGEFISPTGDHIIDIKLCRKGHVKPEFELGVDGETNPDKIIAFSIFRGPRDLSNTHLKEFEASWYDKFLDEAVNVDLRYAPNATVKLRIKRPEHTIATKIANGRDKDIADVVSILRQSKQAGCPIVDDMVKEILCGEDSRYHVQNAYLCERYELLKKLEASLEATSAK